VLKPNDPNSLQYLQRQYQKIHEDPNRYRGRLQPGFVRIITALVQKHDARTLLDYGCGKGHQYSVHKQHEAWGIQPDLYDPGIPELQRHPTISYDGVICTDVAEHIPEEYMHLFLEGLLILTNKFLFMCIFVDPAKARLPDGRNAHLTVRPQSWWELTLFAAAGAIFPSCSALMESSNGQSTMTVGNLEIVVVFRTREHKHWD
jgi:hypothetical protein